MHKTAKLLGVISACALATLALTLQQSFGHGGQGQPNSSTNQSDTKSPPSIQAPQSSGFFKKQLGSARRRGQNEESVEPTEASIAAGKELFLDQKGNCIFCHGETGAGNKENLPQLRRVPADLSDHKRMPKLQTARFLEDYQRHSRHHAGSREAID